MRARFYPALVFTVACFALLVSPLFAQESPTTLASPPKPPTVSPTAANDKEAEMVPKSAVAQEKDPTAPTPPARKRLGKKFWIAWGFAFGMMVADAEITAHCLKRPTCIEGNPILGKKPSRARIYGIKAIPAGLAFYLSQKWKRDDSGGWAILPIAIGSINGGAVIYNLAHGFPPKQPQTPAQPTTTIRKIANMPALEVVPLSLSRPRQ